MSLEIRDVIDWLKQWFYDEGEVDTKVGNLQSQINNKASQSDLNSLSSTVSNKVDKVTGKGLSTNDYTTVEKEKLRDIESEANKTVVDSVLSNNSFNPVQSRVIYEAIQRGYGNVPIRVVDSLPPASELYAGMLYVVTSNWTDYGLYVCAYTLD